MTVPAQVPEPARIAEKIPSDYSLERTTLWSFPDRGHWAGHNGRYRGNWSPHVPRNLILRYTKPGDLVLDPMSGGGTSLVEARLLGRSALGMDINPGAVTWSRTCLGGVPNPGQAVQEVVLGDARSVPDVSSGTVDLVLLHPPYWNVIRYSSSIEGDLSRMDHAGFLAGMREVASEMHRVLRRDGHCAILMGDSRRRKHILPLSFQVLGIFLETGLVLREHAIKVQHNTRSGRSGWTGPLDFLLLAHENLFVFRKPADARGHRPLG